MNLAPLLALVLNAPSIPQDPPANARVAIVAPPTLRWDPAPGLFDVFVSSCWRLRPGPGGLWAIGEDSCVRLDLDAGSATVPSELYARDRVQDLVPWDGRFVRMLVDSVGELTVDAVSRAGRHGLTRPGSRPEPSCAPEQVGIRGFPFVAADGKRLVVLTGTTLFLYADNKWSSKVLDIAEHGHAPPVSRTLLDGTTLYIGTDKGEWGGKLRAADIQTGAISVVSAPWSDGNSNVADIDRGPDGRIWVTIGCVHGRGDGELYTQAGGGWELVARTGGCEEMRDRSVAEWPDIVSARKGADLAPAELAHTGFVALDFDLLGRPILLTETFGLFRREVDGTWTWLTRGWPTWQACATDLAIVGDRAVVSSWNAGVIVIDLETLAARRVRLSD